jgi:hypothetical protein
VDVSAFTITERPSEYHDVCHVLSLWYPHRIVKRTQKSPPAALVNTGLDREGFLFSSIRFLDEDGLSLSWHRI